MDSSLPTSPMRGVAAPCASVIPLNLSALPHHPASMVHEWSSLHVLVVLFVMMMLAGELGFRAGRHHKTPNESGRGHFVAVQASLLALLALLLGFSLNMADQRFEARRASMMDDTITLSSLNIRADFLPEPRRTAFKRLLHDYIAAHLEASSPKTTESEEQFIARAENAEALHKSMCDEVRKEVTGEHPAKGAAEMVAPLVDALAIHRRWVTAMETKVPQSILILLFATAVAAAGVVGYSGGLSAHRGIVQGVLLAVFVSGIIFVIHDLDTPLTGASQSGQRPLLHLKTLLEREDATAR